VGDWPLIETRDLARHLGGFDAARAVNAFAGTAAMGGRIFYPDDLPDFNCERIRLPFADLMAPMTPRSRRG
jgi:hypothetical protein